MRFDFGFERRVALRFLREGRMQSVLIIVGVAAGVAVVAYISALVAGLQRNTLEKTLGTQPHVTLRMRDDAVVAARVPAAGDVTLAQQQPRAQRPRTIVNWPALVPVLEATPGVAAVSPMVSTAGLALRGEAAQAIALMGVELDRYDRIVHVRDKVVAGHARLAPGDAMIGRELAADLGLRVGDRLTVTTAASTAGGSATTTTTSSSGAATTGGTTTGGATTTTTVTTTTTTAAPAGETLRVTALLDLGVRDLNRRTVLVPLRSAQSLAGLPGGATVIDLALTDVWHAKELAADLARRLPYEVESWQQANAQLVSALNAQSVSTALIRAVVMVVVVLGIASVLVVSVVQKQREIGILRAMGATRGQVLRVFLLQGAVVGALGSAAGVVLAVALVKAFTTFVRGADGLPLFSITLEPGTALRIAALATACGVLAAIAPARRAARLDPAQAIRL